MGALKGLAIRATNEFKKVKTAKNSLEQNQ